MKKITAIVLTSFMVIACSTTGNIQTDDSGTFRGKWWNYYHRALASSESERYEDAVRDLKSAIERREKDQWRSRTYGMHFIDYFPHRELGIIYFNRGETDRAISELELSLSQAESAKAIFYLNKARRQQLLDLRVQPAPPEIIVESPADDGIVNDFTLMVKGTVSGQGYVSRLLINGIPYRIDLARKNITFEHPVVIDSDTKKITIVTEDLLGNTSIKSIPLKVDREGPAISISDIVREHNGRDEVIRITGEIDDSTGIVSVRLNDKVIDTGGRTSYEFSVIADKMTFVLQASDRLNNVTRAQIDIAKELAAFQRQETVLLAFNAADIFSSDSVAPVITLKESADMPAVFVDKYYIEGDVSDDRKVENIIVNGRDVLSKKGKKIFFSRLIKLDAGKNRIEVEAFDSSGNRSKKDFTVTRNIPEALQIGNRMSVSILPFDMTGLDSTGEMLAYEYLTGSFVSQKRFNVIERAKLEQVLLEQKLTREKLTDPAYSIQVGRLMASDIIIATSAAVDQRSVEFTSTVINTETSEVMDIRDVYSEDKSASSIKLMMDGLASKVASGFPLVEGHVIRQEKGFIYTDLGAESGIKGNTGVIVYRMGQEIKHPLTGKSLGQDMKNLGTARFQEISEKFSKAKLFEAASINNIKAQDLVITR